jgi:hypothetical protein
MCALATCAVQMARTASPEQVDVGVVGVASHRLSQGGVGRRIPRPIMVYRVELLHWARVLESSVRQVVCEVSVCE